jgi:hypothetical protein
MRDIDRVIVFAWLSAATSTNLPSVAGSDAEASLARSKWRVAPSSDGAGIFDQSGASTVLLVVMCSADLCESAYLSITR